MYNKKNVIQEWTMSSCVAPGLSEVYGSDGIGPTISTWKSCFGYKHKLHNVTKHGLS